MAIKTYVDEDGNLATFDPASSLKMSEIKAEFTGDSTPSLSEYFRDGSVRGITRVRSHDFLHTYKGAYALGFYAERNTPNDTSKMDIKYHIPGVTAAGQITTLSDQSVVPGGTLTYGDNSQYQFKVSDTLLEGSSTRYGVKLRIIKNIAIPTKNQGKPVPISFSDFYGTEKASAVPLDAQKLTINVSSTVPYDGYNLKDELGKYSAWEDPNVLVNEVIVNIRNGVVLGSTDTSVAGFTIADLPEQLKVSVNVEVGAIIVGCGGAGGDAPLNNPMADTGLGNAARAEAEGKPGGPAVKIDHPVGMVYFNIEDRTAFNRNSQSILGGGGGGAAGYTTDSNGVAYGSGGGGGAGGGKGGSCRSGGTVTIMTDPGYRNNYTEWKGLAGISSRRGTNPEEAYLVEPKETIAGGAGGSVVRNLKRLGVIDWIYDEGLSTTNGQTVGQVLKAFYGGDVTHGELPAGDYLDVNIPNLAGSAFVRHNYSGKHTRIFVIVDGRIKYADVGMRNNWGYSVTGGYRLGGQARNFYISHSNGQFSHKWVEYMLFRDNVTVSPTSYTTNFTVSTGGNGAMVPRYNASIGTGIGQNLWSGGTAVEEVIDISNIDLSNLDFGGPGSGTSLFNLNHYGSDENIKEDIEPVQNALELLSQIDGVHFKYKKDGKQSAGVIAQQVEKVLPSAVSTINTDDEEYKAVEYHQLSALFIESIKELKAENEELRLMIKDLKEE